MRSLTWFRTDLRVSDNAALAEASSRGGVVRGLFVVSPGEWRQHGYSRGRIDLWLRSVRQLARELAAVGITLDVRVARALADVPGIVADAARRAGCDSVFANAEYEVNESRRDERTRDACRREGIGFELLHDQVFAPPGEVRTGEGRFFTVFTPFKKALFTRLRDKGIPQMHAAPRKVEPDPGASQEAPAGSLDTLLRDAVSGPREPDWDLVLARLGFEDGGPLDRGLWPAGEREGRARLAAFARSCVLDYKDTRDFPGVAGTSRLSAYLNLGLVSCRQCLHAALAAGELAAEGKGRRAPEDLLDAGNQGVTTWISELVWREFYIHVMAGFPRVCMGRAFQPATERLRWKDNPDHFEAWKKGCTGVPIVDAGMRELRATGWMHNRTRMITAMYLTKNLLLDWRLGEAWFMENLVDGFLASNNGGWQWSASTGTDAAPYFRVFNPVSQSRKFDAEGEYIRRWVPEIRGLETESLHAPWEMGELARTKLDYPGPLVDLKRSRAEAIEAFKALK